MLRFLGTFLLFCLFFGNCRASGLSEIVIPNDTIETSDVFEDSITYNYYRFRPTQLIAPGILLAAGVAGVWGFDGIKESVRHHFAGKHPTSADNYLEFVPYAGYFGLGFIPGVEHRSDWRERLMAGLTSYAVVVVVNNIMKITFREPRPGTGQKNSFPSGHTATAFAGAELMRIEYGNWVGVAGYVVAVTVGALRIYNDRHWINDIIGGAAVGILSARIGYWLVPFERKLFGLEKKKSPAALAIVPVASHAGGAISVALTF